MEDDLAAQRDALVKRLMEPPPRGEGIYGYPVCQDCGQIGSYQGMYAAIGSHRTSEYGSRFSPPSHKHAQNSQRAFCQVCRQSAEPSKLGICPPCQEVFARYADPKDWHKMIAYLIRERPNIKEAI